MIAQLALLLVGAAARRSAHSWSWSFAVFGDLASGAHEARLEYYLRQEAATACERAAAQLGGDA